MKRLAILFVAAAAAGLALRADVMTLVCETDGTLATEAAFDYDARPPRLRRVGRRRSCVRPLPEGLEGKAIAVYDIYGNPIGPESPDRLALTESPIYVIGSFQPLRSDTARVVEGEK